MRTMDRIGPISGFARIATLLINVTDMMERSTMGWSVNWPAHCGWVLIIWVRLMRHSAVAISGPNSHHAANTL